MRESSKLCLSSLQLYPFLRVLLLLEVEAVPNAYFNTFNKNRPFYKTVWILHHIQGQRDPASIKNYNQRATLQCPFLRSFCSPLFLLLSDVFSMPFPYRSVAILLQTHNRRYQPHVTMCLCSDCEDRLRRISKFQFLASEKTNYLPEIKHSIQPVTRRSRS